MISSLKLSNTNKMIPKLKICLKKSLNKCLHIQFGPLVYIILFLNNCTKRQICIYGHLLYVYNDKIVYVNTYLKIILNFDSTKKF